jgi:hypothetical protein
MTSGSRFEDDGLLRSVGGFHSVWPILESFRLPLTVPWALHGSWGGRCLGRFLERLHREVFTWRRRLPLWSNEVDGLASPLHRPTTHSRLPRGQGLPMRRRLVLLR